MSLEWKTRLAVRYNDGGNDITISPIDSFSPSFSLNAEVLHSIEQTHIGVVYSPQALSFSLTVRAIGSVAAQLTVLAMEGKRFNIILQEGEGDDWAFSSIVMSDCIITSATPSTATIAGAPTSTFSGFSLAASVSEKPSGTTSIP